MEELNELVRKSGLKPGLIFDGDDTLWENTSLYDKAFGQFAEAASYLEFTKEHVLQVRERVDMDNTKKNGYSSTGFISSMVEAYQVLCAEKGSTPIPETEETVRAVANKVFDGPFEFYPGVRETLTNLKQKGYLIALLTAGDEKTQQRKVDSTGAESIFGKAATRIVPRKTPEEYLKLMSNLGMDPTETVMVGNSWKSDVFPAVNVGLYVIHIPRDTWAFEKVDEKQIATIPANKYFKTFSFSEVPEVLQEIRTISKSAKEPIKN